MDSPVSTLGYEVHVSSESSSTTSSIAEARIAQANVERPVTSTIIWDKDAGRVDVWIPSLKRYLPVFEIRAFTYDEDEYAHQIWYDIDSTDQESFEVPQETVESLYDVFAQAGLNIDRYGDVLYESVPGWPKPKPLSPSVFDIAATPTTESYGTAATSAAAMDVDVDGDSDFESSLDDSSETDYELAVLCDELEAYRNGTLSSVTRTVEFYVKDEELNDDHALLHPPPPKAMPMFTEQGLRPDDEGALLLMSLKSTDPAIKVPQTEFPSTFPKMLFTRAFALLASLALAAAVCETSDNSPNTGDCYAAAQALTDLGGKSCCQRSPGGCTQMMVRGNCRVAVCGYIDICRTCSDMGTFTRDLINACKNDAIGKIGGKSNSFDNVHIEVWRT
ncbi:hypothetical protein AURDEDRAFT_155890 [Auricularia subglabra TFB-10046 SS5]|nr:hypothetical protein AURDEDRAFT_155890 [Auricularia subglabra TFB-10046 SS5]